MTIMGCVFAGSTELLEKRNVVTQALRFPVGEGADRAVMASNANALRRSIMYIMIGATAFNVALYVGLFFTYGKDKSQSTQQQQQQSPCQSSATTSQTSGGGLKYPWPSIVLYHVVSFINAYDTQILSLSMRALEASLGLSASSLSIMASMEGMTLMGFAPVWGYLLTLWPCQYVCAAGMALCGISCVLLAQVTTFSWILLIRLVHGIGLSCAAPVAVHIIAANWGSNKGTNQGTSGKSGTNNSKDGTWSGINNGIVTLGKLTCFFLTGRYAGQKVFGHSGWRLSYAVVGCVWLFAALPVCQYMTKNGGTTNNSDDASTKLKEIIKKPKFWAMTAVEFFSEAPYVIMGYMVMYLEYSGLSVVMIGSGIIVMQVGVAIGSFGGGVIAGKFNHWHSKYGRLSLATCALIIRIACLVGLLSSPLNEHGLTWHRYCLLFVIGLTMLVSPTIEKPIVSDLEKDAASMTVPLYRAIGGMPSYFVFMPLLGFIAEKMYGYVKPSGDVSQLGHVVMSVNANALRKSMMWILSIATVLNIGLYVVVHYADQLGDALKALSCSASTASTGTGTLSCPYISKPKPYPWYAVLLYHIAEFMEGYNMQCTPVCMRALEMSFGVTASKLSFMYAVDLVSVLGIGAVWGYLLDTPLGKQKRKMEVQHVCCLGALVCGMGSILLGCTSSYPLILCSRFLQGGGLACVTQVCTKIIIEQWSMPLTEAQSCQKPASQTSLWFGLGFGVHCLGRVASLFLVGRIATWNVIGQYGWRLNYVLAGYVWLLLSVPVHCLMKKTGTGTHTGGVDGAHSYPTNGSGGEPQTAAVTVISSTSMTSTSATSSISISNAQGGVVGTSAPSTTPSTTKSESGGPENGTAAENAASGPSAPTNGTPGDTKTPDATFTVTNTTTTTTTSIIVGSGSKGQDEQKNEVREETKPAPSSAQNVTTSAGTHGFIHGSTISCTSNPASNNGTGPTTSCKSSSTYRSISEHKQGDKKIPFYQKTTFWLMGLIMYTSEVPFVTMAFMVLYLQYCGLSDEMAGYVVALVQGSSVAGSFASGPAVDWCHAKSEDYGRLCFAMCVIALRLLCITLLLWWPIENGSLGLRHWASLSIIGCTFFVGAIIDRPTVADVAKGNESLAGSIFRLMGGIPSYATLSPTIAFLAERRFGYVKTNELVQDMHPATRLGNANALRMAMICVSGVISITNILLYIPVLYTYPTDKGDRKMSVKVEARTTVTAAAGTSPSCGDNSTKDAEPSVSYTPWAKVLYHVYPVMDAIDMEILPICMRAFEVAFGCSPATLSVVGAAEQAAVLLMSPLWGYLLTIIKPYQVESAAMLVCGMMCILLGTTTNYRMLVLATLVHGAVLGCTGPSHHKIITSSVKKDQRDMWYGIFTGVYYLAAMASSILASRLSLRNVLGQYGWRLYYCVVGYMWLTAAVPTYYGMRPKEKPNGEGKNGSTGQSGGKGTKFWESIRDLFTKPSYYFMISLIYVSESCELFMGYIVIYLQYCGVRNQMAGFAISVVHMGNMIAGFIGGYAIQKIHCASKDYGKLLTGIGIIAIRLFAITVLLRKPFQGGDMRWYHYMCLLLFGVAMLNRTSIDRTMLSDFVNEKDSAIALSLCRVIAGIPSNFTFPPLIGYLAERAFGYIKTDALVEDMDAFTKVTNATALSKSLLYIMGGSCLANMALYGGMMFTYKTDVDKLKNKECKEVKDEAKNGKEDAAGGGGGKAASGAKQEYELIAFILAAFVSFMDGFDTQILPSCMKVFEIDLGLTPSMLSVINSASFLSLLVASPLWGWLVDRYNCGYIQCIAMLLAGLTCVLHGYTSSYPVIVILTIFNGAGLACTAPIDQKIITANWPDNSGVYFGISWTCYCLGRVASSTIGSRLIMRNVAGQYGWRMYCFITGYIWIIASIIVHFFMKKKNGAGGQGSSSSSSNCPKNENKGGTTNDKGDFFQKLKRLSKITTFWLLIPIKYASSAPLVILSYMVMYYQNSGLSDNMAGFAVGIVQLGSGIGGTGVGWVADQIHKKENKYARIGFAIGALVLRVLCVILLLWSPLEGASLRWYQYGGLFVMGLTLFTIQTVDKAMLGNVVSKSDQSTAISLVYFIAGIPSSTTLPTFVGYMAEKRFGYVVSKATDEPLHPVTMANNATALRKAMIYCMLIASFVNIVFYGATMVTYKGDVDKLKKKEANECKETKGTEEGNGTVSSGEAGGGSGTSNVGGTSETQAAPSSEGGGSSGSGASGGASSGAQLQASGDSQTTTVSQSPTPGSATTSPTVTVTTTSVTCTGLSESKGSNGSGRNSGANSSTTAIITCDSSKATSGSGTNEVTSCIGASVHESKSDDATTTTTLATCDSSSISVGSGRIGSTSCIGASQQSKGAGSSTTSAVTCDSASISATSTSGLGAVVGIGSCSGISVSKSADTGTESYDVTSSTSLGFGIGVGVATPTSEGKGTSGCSVSTANAVTVKAYKGIRISFGIRLRSRLKFSIKGSPKSSK
ncbi:multiplied multi-transmembrane transporter-like protein [Babesia gibsoni]|uniref:Multiplied multi-transmembrane transporter-like protein n=1 Tax=Babesia gibsoni TaxID=33632 RepID=A0AAD8LGB5_BABGI|nr:multiplied multi-transmembrane transporter-like protein [Babesia gibsoni]